MCEVQIERYTKDNGRQDYRSMGIIDSIDCDALFDAAIIR